MADVCTYTCIKRTKLTFSIVKFFGGDEYRLERIEHLTQNGNTFHRKVYFDCSQPENRV